MIHAYNYIIWWRCVYIYICDIYMYDECFHTCISIYKHLYTAWLCMFATMAFFGTATVNVNEMYLTLIVRIIF